MSTYTPTEVEIAKEKLKPWPGTAGKRFLITSGVAMIPILLSVITFSIGGLSNDTYSPNSALLITVRELVNNGAGFTWMATLYPPFSLLIAAVVNYAGGFASLIMALIGSVFAAFLIVSIIAMLRQKRVDATMRIVLIAVVVLNPIIYWQAIYNLPAIISLTFIAVGLGHTVRFVQWGGTYNGFVAGLCFAGAILSNNAATLMVAIAILAVVSFRWFHGTKLVAILGMVLVLVYPTLLGMLGLAVASWVINGDVFAFLNPVTAGTDYSAIAIEQPTGALINIPWLNWFQFGSLHGFDGITAFLPVLFLIGISIGWRGRFWAAITGTLFVLVQVPVTYFPLSFPSGFPWIALTVIGIVLLAEERNRRRDWLIIALCAAQLGLGWLTAVDRPTTVLPWINLLTGN